GREAVKRDRDDDRAERRPEPMARAAKNAHHHGIHDGRDLESLADRDIADIDRIDAADGAGDARRQCNGAELVAEGRYAFDLGDVFVIMDGEKTESHAR